MTDTRPQFSRITEGTKRHSWRAAVPAVVVLVAFIGLIAYLASSLSSYSQKASTAERDANQYRDQVAAMGKQVGDLQKDLSLSRSPGRTTVIVEAAQPAKPKKGVAPAGERSWAAVTWGELPSGKSWMRVNAYGLSQKLDGGKAYHLWMAPQTGDPIDIGAVEIDQNGSGYVMKAELPGVDQGKSVMLTLDAQDAKQPGEVIAKADLPKLQPTMAAPPTQAQDAQQSAAPASQAAPANQAKSGTESQQMHQSGK
jgi:Anti-sigma-K factor rskA